MGHGFRRCDGHASAGNAAGQQPKGLIGAEYQMKVCRSS